METQQCGAEMRRLNIVYFLSRKGRIEQPHLIRVHHLSRNGVRLRDIKRWLGDLRGKDMPESFSWSYKRRYKTGYVWQDLLDDDLITPISDNEYVVKGSEISSTVINRDFSSHSMQKDKQSSFKESAKDQKTDENQSHSSETSAYVPTKSSSEIEEESPIFGSDTSTITDDSGKLAEMDKNSDKTRREKRDKKFENSSSSFDNSNIKNKKNKSKTNQVKINDNINSTPADSSEPRIEKSKSYSNGASNLFRNLMTCGVLSTNDSALVMMNKQNKYPFLNVCSSDQSNVHSTQICKRDKLGGSHRIFGTPNLIQHQWSGRKSCDGVMDSTKNKNEFRDQRGVSCAAYKLVNGPNCSQCGKPFNPEKLHTHMKSCKGMKALFKGTNNNNTANSSAAEKASSQILSTQS